MKVHDKKRKKYGFKGKLSVSGYIRLVQEREERKKEKNGVVLIKNKNKKQVIQKQEHSSGKKP